MPDRRRQRQQRVRHDAGGNQNSVGASNREPEPAQPKTAPTNTPARQAGSGVVYAEARQYESVTVMPDKEVAAPQKYRRPGVLSNWSRYEEASTDDIEEGEDYLLGEDFSLVLEQQGNSGGEFLKLKGESGWEDDEASILSSHGLGVLHVADLVRAMGTLPLYMQLNMPEETLPESVLEFYTHLAEDNKKLYKPNNTAYHDSLDFNQKIIQRLTINDNEPVELSSEETDNKQTTRNAVDVALSLSEAFDQAPEDVDLTAFIQEPIEESQASSVKQPSPARQPSLEKQSTPEVQECATTDPSPAVHHNVTEEPFAQSTTGTLENTSLQKQAKSEPVNRPSVQSKDKSSPSPGFDFGLQKVNAKVISEPNQDLTKMTAPSTSLDVKGILNVNDVLTPNEDEEASVEGPAVDLDAPQEKSKPVLVVSKTEAEDLEDWLDSMLDD